MSQKRQIAAGALLLIAGIAAWAGPFLVSIVAWTLVGVLAFYYGYTGSDSFSVAPWALVGTWPWVSPESWPLAAAWTLALTGGTVLGVRTRRFTHADEKPK